MKDRTRQRTKSLDRHGTTARIRDTKRQQHLQQRTTLPAQRSDQPLRQRSNNQAANLVNSHRSKQQCSHRKKERNKPKRKWSKQQQQQQPMSLFLSQSLRLRIQRNRSLKLLAKCTQMPFCIFNLKHRPKHNYEISEVFFIHFRVEIGQLCK